MSCTCEMLRSTWQQLHRLADHEGLYKVAMFDVCTKSPRQETHHMPSISRVDSAIVLQKSVPHHYDHFDCEFYIELDYGIAV